MLPQAPSSDTTGWFARDAETFARVRKHPQNARGIRDVTNERDRVTADLCRYFFDLLGRTRSNGDARAFTCKCEGDRASNASTTAGDQRRFSV